MACHEGYLYIYDKHRGIIKTQRKIGHSAILDFDFTKCAEEVIVLLKSGNIVISYARNLELIFLLPSYRDMAEGAKLIIVSEERCLVVGERHISNFRIQNNK